MPLESATRGEGGFYEGIKHGGMVAKIKEKVGLEPLLAPGPQIAGALGAAIFARDRYLAKQKAS